MSSKKIFLMMAMVFSLSAVLAQVEKFTINEQTYYGIKTLPPEIKGVYRYEKTKEPIVEIDYNGTNSFQFHGVPKYPAQYWVQTDEKGNILKQTSTVNRNYQIVLIVKYGDNGETGWKGKQKDQLDRISLTMNVEEGWAIVLGERFKKL